MKEAASFRGQRVTLCTSPRAAFPAEAPYHVNLYIWICEELSKPAELATAVDTENLNSFVEEFKQYVQVDGVAADDTLATSKALLDFFESFITCAQADEHGHDYSLSTAEAILAVSQARGDRWTGSLLVG